MSMKKYAIGIISLVFAFGASAEPYANEECNPSYVEGSYVANAPQQGSTCALTLQPLMGAFGVLTWKCNSQEAVTSTYTTGWEPIPGYGEMCVTEMRIRNYKTTLPGYTYDAAPYYMVGMTPPTWNGFFPTSMQEACDLAGAEAQDQVYYE